VAGVVVLILAFCVGHSAYAHVKGQRMSTAADRYVEAFRRGEEFRGPSTGLVVGGTVHAPSGKIMQGKPDPAALARLARELTSGSAFVRSNVVALLVDVGLQVDPGRPAGTEALRNKEIIEILVKAGLGRRDAAREATMEALRKLARPADLAPWSRRFVKALEQKPSDDALLLVAKAKAIGAKPFVDKLARSADWEDEESLKIAQASLGDRARENEFVQMVAQAHEAKDSEGFAEALAPLRMIGTHTSLAALARYLRTPLTLLVPGAYEQSLRLSVLGALMYAYPDRPEFYPNNILSEVDYQAAERVCSQELGVTYAMPAPPFMTYRPFPRR
jgi:hypothetical protein